MTTPSEPQGPAPGSVEDAQLDHVAYAGEVIPDPWDDPEQTDWPTSEGGAGDGVGADEEPGAAA